MTFRYDEHGRQIGLDWDAIRTDEVSRPRTAAQAAPFPAEYRYTGSPRQKMCGAGLHLMSEHGREVKGGSKGRYCNACKNERARRYTAERRRKSRAKPKENS